MNDTLIDKEKAIEMEKAYNANNPLYADILKTGILI